MFSAYIIKFCTLFAHALFRKLCGPGKEEAWE
jgi:hypothetical protein